MDILANWNGQEMPLADVRVSVLDRAFLFGDAVYEVIRIYGGRAWHGSEHIDRLRCSLEELQIEFDVSVLPDRLQRLLQTTGLQEALAYIQVTRGAAERHHFYPSNATANCLMYIEQFNDPFSKLRETGAKAITYPDFRWGRNDIKATSLAANCMAANAAKQRGCIEAILIKNGTITEGSHTSVFGVIDGKLIVSPSSAAVLPGITKKQVIELCHATGIEMQEGRLLQSQLPEIAELLITATPEEIIGIVEVDDVPIGTGKPGPITLRLQQQFKQTVAAWLKPGTSQPA